MRDNYNRPQMRGYWDAPKSKEESRYETLFLTSACSLTRSFARSTTCLFLCSFGRSFSRSLARLFVILLARSLGEFSFI